MPRRSKVLRMRQKTMQPRRRHKSSHKDSRFEMDLSTCKITSMFDDLPMELSEDWDMMDSNKGVAQFAQYLGLAANGSSGSPSTSKTCDNELSDDDEEDEEDEDEEEDEDDEEEEEEEEEEDEEEEEESTELPETDIVTKESTRKAEPSSSKVSDRKKNAGKLDKKLICKGNGDETILVNLKSLNTALEDGGIACPECKTSQIEVRVPSHKFENGYQVMETYCRSCKRVMASQSTTKMINVEKYSSKQTHAYVTGLRYALGAIAAGIGYKEVNAFITSLKLPSISHKIFNEHLSVANNMIIQKAKELKDISAKFVVNEYKVVGDTPDDDGMMDIAVSYDGKWMARGENSLICVAFVVDVRTGTVLDFNVLTKSCRTCMSFREEGKTIEEILNWEAAHEDECKANFCLENFDSMELENAKILFERSSERNLRYTTIVSEENSCSSHIAALKPYGELHPISVVNGLAYMSFITFKRIEEVGLKDTTSPASRVTLNRINIVKLTKLYNRTILLHKGNFPLLKERLLGVVLHLSATDSNPSHHYCPKGKNSWCKYQIAIADGNQPDDDWHKVNTKHYLSNFSHKGIYNVFTQISSDQALAIACGYVNIMNKSLHNSMWKMIPQGSLTNSNQVRYAVSKVATKFNCSSDPADILRELGILPVKPATKKADRANSDKKSDSSL